MTVSVSACGNGPDAAPQISTAITVENGAETSGATAVPATEQAQSTDTGAEPVEDGATVLSCMWRWFDRYDIELMLPDEVPAGTTFDVEAVTYASDTTSFSARGSFVAEGGGRQLVEATVDRPQWIEPDRLEAEGELAPPPGTFCQVQVSGDGFAYGGFADLTWVPDPPESDGSELGDLLASVTTADALMLPLAELLWLDPEPAFDTIHVAPDMALYGISVEREGTCRFIRSAYRVSGEATTFVSQSWGCPAPSETAAEGRVIETVAEDPWLVRVEGSVGDVKSLVEDLRPMPVPGGEGVDGPSTPSPDQWLDGYIESHADITELARFEWRSGKISIVRRKKGIELSAYENPLTYGMDANYGSTVSGCDEYTVGIASSWGSIGGESEPGGYAWFVARDKGTLFVISVPGLPETVPLVQAPSGEFVGFLDIGEAHLDRTSYSVLDAAGAVVPCTQ